MSLQWGNAPTFGRSVHFRHQARLVASRHGRERAADAGVEQPGVVAIARVADDSIDTCKVDLAPYVETFADARGDFGEKGVRARSDGTPHHHLLDLDDRRCREQALRADIHAVQDRPAAKQSVGVFEVVEPVAGRRHRGRPAAARPDRRTYLGSTNSSGRPTSSRRTGCTRTDR